MSCSLSLTLTTWFCRWCSSSPTNCLWEAGRMPHQVSMRRLLEDSAVFTLE